MMITYQGSWLGVRTIDDCKVPMSSVTAEVWAAMCTSMRCQLHRKTSQIL